MIRSFHQRNPLHFSLLFLWALLLSLLTGWPSLFYPLGSDQATFLYVARIWEEGGLPYRDALDTKPPGIFLLYLLADIIFGQHVYSYRIFEIVVSALSIFLFRYIFSAMNLRGAILAHFLFVLFYFVGNDFWNLGQVEFSLGIAALSYLALILATSRSEERYRIFTFMAGFVLGFIILLKQNYLLLGFLYLYFLWLRVGGIKKIFRSGLSPLLTFISGALILPLVLIFYYAYNESLYDLYYGTLKLPYLYARHANLPSYSFIDYGPTLLFNSGFVILFVAGVVGMWRGGGDIGKLVTGCFFILFLSVVVQQKFWLYQLIVLLPFMAIFIIRGGYVLYEFICPRIKKTIVLGALVFLFLIEIIILPTDLYLANHYAFGSSKSYLGALNNTIQLFNKSITKEIYFATFYGPYHSPVEDYRLGMKIKETDNEVKTLQLLEYRPAVYIYSGRKAAHKYFFGTMLLLVGGRERRKMEPEYLELTFRSHRPGFIVFGLDGPWRSDEMKIFNPELYDYRLITVFETKYHPKNPLKKATFGIFRDVRK